MFTYPVFSGGDAFASSEYIFYKDQATGAYLYKYVDLTAGTISNVASLGTISGGAESVATDGQFVFISSSNWGGAYITYQYSYNGGTFTQRLAAAPANQFQSSAATLWLPTNPGRLVQGGGTSGLGVFTYQSAPTYSYGSMTFRTEAADNWIGAHDVRFLVPGKKGVGDGLVTMPNTNNNQYINSYTLSGATFTKYGGNVSCGSYPYPSAMGVDRDYGNISLAASSNNTVLLLQYNMSNRQISSVGASSAMPSNVACTTWVDGYLIVQGTDGVVRSYGVSGTTLSLKDSITYGGSSPTLNHQALVSPYTKHVYLSGGGSLRCIRVNADGTMDEVASHASEPAMSTTQCHKIAFVENGLVDT